MRGRGRHTNRRPPTEPAQPVSTTSWTKAHHEVGSNWMRRTYTRTIPKDLRTVEQLRLSFDDARQQWRTVCDDFRKRAGATEGAPRLPPGVRGAVDQVVSQVKAVKQELLAHLTRHLATLTASAEGSAAVAIVAEAAFQTGGEGIRDLVMTASHGGSAAGISAAADGGGNGSEKAKYLQALLLARRVWVWSVCLACATMDLELLSGSVSVATQLFSGCPYAAVGTYSGCGGGGDSKLHSCVLHSSYDLHGAITEAELCCAAAADNAAQPGESCELRAFLGFPCRVEDGSSLTPSADPTGTVKKANSTFSRVLVMGDAFWMHAIALCYSAVVQDDASAARLLAFFDEARKIVSEQQCVAGGEGAASTDNGAGGASHAEQRDDTSANLPQVQLLLFHIRLVAHFLLEEDYPALQRLWHCEGYQQSCDVAGLVSQTTTSVAKPEVFEGAKASLQQQRSSLLAATQPEGYVVVLLVRLLGEHVVRRRWAEQGLGQSFRPIEPIVRPDATAANPNRLVSALSVLPRENAPQSTDVAYGMESSCALRLCHTLQVAALCDMGGDWPLPSPLLRSAFGGGLAPQGSQH